MNKERLVAVLAKTKKQFRQYVNRDGREDTKYIYAARTEKIRGTLLDDYVVIGNFYERRDADKIEELAKLRKQMKEQVEE